MDDFCLGKIFVKKCQTRPLFVYFSFFSHDKYITNLIINDKRVDGVRGTRTQGGRMVGADESTELWQHPSKFEIRSGGQRHSPSNLSIRV